MMHAYKEGGREGETKRERGRWRTAPTACDSATQVTKLTNWPIWPILLWFYFWQTASPPLAPPSLLISKLPLRLRHSSQGSSSFPIPRFDVLFTAVSLFDSCSETCHATAMCKQETCAWAEWGKTTVNLKLKSLLLLCCNCKWQPFFSVVAPCNTSHALVLFLSRIESRVSRSASSAKSH